MTLYYAAKIFILYLKGLKLCDEDYAVFLRVLRDVLRYYGYDYPLFEMTGSAVLLYAELHDPCDPDPEERQKGMVFWKFVHFLKKNKMIPAWAKEPAE